jgi:hypothetical protein
MRWHEAGARESILCPCAALRAPATLPQGDRCWRIEMPHPGRRPRWAIRWPGSYDRACGHFDVRVEMNAQRVRLLCTVTILTSSANLQASRKNNTYCVGTAQDQCTSSCSASHSLSRMLSAPRPKRPARALRRATPQHPAISPTLQRLITKHTIVLLQTAVKCDRP